MLNKKTHNVVIESKDSLGADFILKHGALYNIVNAVHTDRNSFVVRIKSVVDDAITVVNIDRDKNFTIKFT